MSDELLTYARRVVGLPMRGKHAGRHFGYTTDGGKANAIRDAGAIVTTVRPLSGDGPTGYEVSFAEGAAIVRRVEP